MTMASQGGSSESYLLLLPSARPVDVKSTYEKSILEVLEILAENRKKLHETTVLEIAVACPHLVNVNSSTRRALYAETQALVAAVYKLIVSVATRLSLDIEDADGEDIRVLLVAWSPDVTTHIKSYGPAISIEALAASKRPWVTAFGDESDAGVQFLQAFYNAHNHVQSDCAGCGNHEQHSHALDDTANDQRLRKVAVGGTFDHLHIGHKLLLTMTAFALDAPYDSATSALVIGISSADLLMSKKHAEYLESWTERAHAVLNFLRSIVDFDENTCTGSSSFAQTADKPSDGGAPKQTVIHRFSGGLVVHCVEITDPCGPTITDPAIDGLVLSAETRAGGQTINDKRKEQDWSPLQILEVDVLDADENERDPQSQDFHSKLSSTAIRAKLAQPTGT